MLALLTAALIPVPAAHALVQSTPISTDSPDHAVGPVGRVNDIAEANGLIYLVGDFTKVGGQTRNFAAAINKATGQVDTSWNPNLNGVAYSIDVAPDGSAVYVGGVFTKVGPTWRSRIAKLDPDSGEAITGWNPKASAQVATIQATADTVYIGGYFTTAGNIARARLAAVDAATGVVDPTWNPGANGPVLTSALSADGAKLFVGGNFTRLGGAARPRLGAVGTGGGSVLGWNPAPPHKVLDAELSANGSILYAAIGGPQVDGGNLATAYDTGTGAVIWNHSSDGDFQAVAVSADAIYYGGHFVKIEGQSRQRIAAFHPTSGALKSWNPGSNSAWGIWALTYTDRLYAGGDFSTIGGRTQKHFAVFTNGQNLAPTASFTSGCAALNCQFDASGSVDPDGSIVSRSWNFGDGTSGNGKTPTHTYSSAGTYAVTLTVTDNNGASDTSTETVQVSAAGNGIAFVGKAGASNNASSFNVTVPAGVSPYDGLLLFATVNDSAAAVSNPVGVTGWTRLGTVVDESMQTVVWTKPADPGDAGSRLTVNLGSAKKASISLMAYTGTDPNSPVATWMGVPETIKQAAHTTPNVVTSIDGSWIVSYWADKTSSTTNWTPPGSEKVRREAIGSGNGRISVLLTDTRVSHPAGTYGSKTATANSSNNKATMVTVALKPMTGTINQRPTAAFSSSCNGLTCSFNATDSFDPDGSIVSYRWQFGDGTTTSGAARNHGYGTYGTYPVTLTVTDNDGATDGAVQNVSVIDPNTAAITFVGSDSAGGNTVNHKVEVPPGVQTGDSLLLFFSTNSETVSVSNPTGVTGWDRLDEVSSDTMQTVAWTKVAAAGDAGTTLTVALGARQKGTLMIAAYSGTHATNPIHVITSAPETTKRAGHTTPQLNTTRNGAWIVSYWADKTSATTDWTLPAGEMPRGEAYTIGSGRVTSVLSDTGVPHSPGTYGGKTATASSSNAKATMWTVALRPLS